MNLSADRLDVLQGERIRVALVGGTWMVGASEHTANELRDVGFQVVSLVDVLPGGSDWQQGNIVSPGFPSTLVWGELQALSTASFQRQLTDDLYIARAWPAPVAPPSASLLHPYDVDARAPSIVEGRAVQFGVAYVLARQMATA